jgi:hypothetical protein
MRQCRACQLASALLFAVSLYAQPAAPAGGLTPAQLNAKAKA